MGKKRRKQFCSVFLEDLPNELLAQILTYLDGVDSVVAFWQLNHRFQALVIEHCQYFDFQSISKFKFDLIVKHQYTQRWKSLTLSDDEHTPDFVEHFTRTYSVTRDFPQLKSITLLNLSARKTYGILAQLSHLSSLVSLTMKSICGETMVHIDLPNLKRLVCGSCLHTNWLENLSQLQSLEYSTVNCHWVANGSQWPSTLRHLKIIFDYDAFVNELQNSLAHLPLLTRLEIYQREIGTQRPDGRSWEPVIRASLPLLTVFKFCFQFSYPQQPTELQDVIATFSTPFYLLNKWFVRIEVSERARWRAVLYSLPFPYHTYRAIQGPTVHTISTLPAGDAIQPFSDVKTLEVFYKTSEPNGNFAPNTAVTHLFVYNEFESKNWMHVLTNLQQVHLDHPTNMSSNNFLHLLANAPHLRSLIIEKRLLQLVTNHWNHTTICEHLSRKIVSLKLCGMSLRSRSINQHELQQLLRIFSPKCRHLSLQVQSLETTIALILENMSQLHSLHINVSAKNYPSIDMQWLEKQQTVYDQTNCVLINKQPDFYFWLGKHA